MESKIKKIGFCDFCQKLQLNKQTYAIYRIEIITQYNSYTLSILKVIEELNDFLLKRGSHISSTQVILLRPDIMLEFLKEKYNIGLEEVNNYGLFQAEICEDCYKSYKEEIPER